MIRVTASCCGGDCAGMCSGLQPAGLDARGERCQRPVHQGVRKPPPSPTPPSCDPHPTSLRTSELLTCNRPPRRAQVWDLTKGFCTKSVVFSSTCNAVCFTGDGALLPPPASCARPPRSKEGKRLRALSEDVTSTRHGILSHINLPTKASRCTCTRSKVFGFLVTV